MKKKKTGFIVLILCLCIIGIFLAVLFIRRSAENQTDNDAAADEEAYSEAVYAEKTPLLLYLNQSDYSVGAAETAKLTVFYSDEVESDIVITDDRGAVLCELKNDGSGCLEAEIPVLETEPRVGAFTAVSGEYASAPVSFFVLPEITEEMVSELVDVAQELGDYALSGSWEDPLGEDALKEIKAWLEQDERIEAVTINNGILLFETVSHLMGSYGMGVESPDSFGFSEAEDVFKAYQSGGDTSALYIKSGIPITNTNMLHINPIPENRVCVKCDSFFQKSEAMLAGGTGCSLQWVTGEDTIGILTGGDIVDYSYLSIETHGSTIKRKDGGNLLFMNWGEHEVAASADMLKATGLEVYEYARFWGSIRDGDDSYRMVYDVTVQDGVRKYSVRISSNYLECVLADRTFDNTVIYFIVCYAMSDDRLTDFLIDHGAAAVIGCKEALDGGIAVATLEQIAQIMGTTGKDGSFGGLNKVVSSRISSETDRLIRTEFYTDEEDYLGYVRKLQTRPVRYKFSADYSDRVFAGEGKLSGKVLQPAGSGAADEDYEKAEEAEVSLSLWQNHDFREVWSGTTDSDGFFEADGIPYGTYAVYAKKDGMDGFVTAVVENGAKEEKAEDVLLHFKGAENNGGNVVRYQGSLYYWKYNSESFNSPATFAYYYPVQSTVNQLVCRHEDGSEEILLSTQGNGPIFIVGGRIYLEKDNTTLFSVKLDGSDRVEHGIFEPWAADEASGTLIGTSYAQGGGVYLLRAEDHKLVKVSDEGYTFLGAIDGYCYYTSTSSGKAPGFTLFRVSIDGSEVTELDSMTKQSGDILGLDICELSKLNDTIYYSYGFYAGTGGFFQNGGINCVDVDGSNKKVCVEYGGLNAEEFLAEEKDGQVFIYYIGSDDVNGSYIGFWDDYPYSGCYVKNMSTGETKKSDFALSRPGAFVCMDGGIYMIKENSAAYSLLIPQETANDFGFVDTPGGSEKTLALISRLDVIGDEVFFTVDWSIRAPENDFGWRPGYARERSTFYTMKIGDKEAAELYSY